MTSPNKSMRGKWPLSMSRNLKSGQTVSSVSSRSRQQHLILRPKSQLKKHSKANSQQNKKQKSRNHRVRRQCEMRQLWNYDVVSAYLKLIMD